MDWYTKAVLTVIALALSVIAFQQLAAQPAMAEQGTLRVTICDDGASYRCAKVTTGGALKIGS